MAKWNVHFGMRLTHDVEVEADSREEAIEKARTEWYVTAYSDMDCAETDVDAWEE